ncbi:MAG: hypothetical protein ICCCNLDF_00554 [Planctomycetes bacterium]|nr:hypothetical protein [Planctomycetota bacterium]
MTKRGERSSEKEAFWKLAVDERLRKRATLNHQTLSLQRGQRTV